MKNRTVFAVYNSRIGRYLLRGSSQSPRLYFDKSQAISAAKTFIRDCNYIQSYTSQQFTLADIEIREFELGPYKATKLVQE